MRQRFEAAEAKLNAVLFGLTEMPEVSIDTASRTISLTAPEQFPDEALVLPAPAQEEAPKNETSDEVPVTTDGEK